MTLPRSRTRLLRGSESAHAASAGQSSTRLDLAVADRMQRLVTGRGSLDPSPSAAPPCGDRAVPAPALRTAGAPIKSPDPRRQLGVAQSHGGANRRPMVIGRGAEPSMTSMILANRPWQLVSDLSKVIVATLATATFLSSTRACGR